MARFFASKTASARPVPASASGSRPGPWSSATARCSPSEGALSPSEAPALAINNDLKLGLARGRALALLGRFFEAGRGRRVLFDLQSHLRRHHVAHVLGVQLGLVALLFMGVMAASASVLPAHPRLRAATVRLT